MKRNLFGLIAVIFLAFISTGKLSAQGSADQQAKGDTVKSSLIKAQSLAQKANPYFKVPALGDKDFELLHNNEDLKNLTKQ